MRYSYSGGAVAAELGLKPKMFSAPHSSVMQRVLLVQSKYDTAILRDEGMEVRGWEARGEGTAAADVMLHKSQLGRYFLGIVLCSYMTTTSTVTVGCCPCAAVLPDNNP